MKKPKHQDIYEAIALPQIDPTTRQTLFCRIERLIAKLRRKSRAKKRMKPDFDEATQRDLDRYLAPRKKRK